MVALDIRTLAILRLDTLDHRKSQGYDSLTTDVVVEPKVEIREKEIVDCASRDRDRYRYPWWAKRLY
jgi:hypothetical protein